PTVGGPECFSLYGQDIRVRGGRLVNAAGALAGAHVDMVTSLRRLHRDGGIPLARCVAMVTDLPRAAMGLPPLRIASGTQAAAVATLDDGLRFAGWLG
ncbi:MAG TPA: N-acetylglucosamine-6-phosphate deacetylase, partial [Paracoccus sp. (in: a-proteobacteria)]|nr:N-acetylglucosamine-6-phosphate deacetylase [Paracoccus sp. (in: a-proteobacteria)]